MKNHKGGHYGALTQRAAQSFLTGIHAGLAIDARRHSARRGQQVYDVVDYRDTSTPSTLGTGDTPREALAAAGFEVKAGAFDVLSSVREHLAFCAEYGRPVVESKVAWEARISAEIKASEDAARGRVDVAPFVEPPLVFNCARCGNCEPVGQSSVYCDDCLAREAVAAPIATVSLEPCVVRRPDWHCDFGERHLDIGPFIPCQDCRRPAKTNALAQELDKVAEVRRALRVIVLDPCISDWLNANDPKALEQARRALGLDDEAREPGITRECSNFSRISNPDGV